MAVHCFIDLARGSVVISPLADACLLGDANRSAPTGIAAAAGPVRSRLPGQRPTECRCSPLRLAAEGGTGDDRSSARRLVVRGKARRPAPSHAMRRAAVRDDPLRRRAARGGRRGRGGRRAARGCCPAARLQTSLSCWARPRSSPRSSGPGRWMSPRRWCHGGCHSVPRTTSSTSAGTGSAMSSPGRASPPTAGSRPSARPGAVPAAGWC